MSEQSFRILDESLYTMKFGINGGLTVVRAISYEKLMSLTLDQLKQLFQPMNASKLRQLGFEALVNSAFSKRKNLVIHDLVDIAELSITISSQQFRNEHIKKQMINDLLGKVKIRSKESQIFLDTLLDMFDKQELEITIVHPRQFGKMFNTEATDTLEYMIDRVTKQLHQLKHFYMVRLGHDFESKEKHFISVIFPSLVRALNPNQGEGRRIRGQREIRKHRTDILHRGEFNYTANETAALLSLIDQTINEGEKYGNSIS